MSGRGCRPRAPAFGPDGLALKRRTGWTGWTGWTVPAGAQRSGRGYRGCVMELRRAGARYPGGDPESGI
ncbi:hypothetical protein, partial [Streptomyces scabiei]|uniref:hypothetical protein n=1 Tax=Streptomyces scabiei TaxID=1930 RepID=UPI001C4F42D9